MTHTPPSLMKVEEVVLNKIKKALSEMSAVDQATIYAETIIHRECRGNGDKENAIRRLEAKYGLSYWTLWGLLYRKPRDIAADQFLRLRHAYLDMCETQIRRLQHELEVERLKGDAAAYEDLDSEAKALAEKLAKAKAG